MKKKIEVKAPKKLEERIEEIKDKSEDFKALILKLVNKFGSITEVSKITGIDDSTISSWLRNWNKKSQLKSKRGQGGGRKDQLSKEQTEEFILELKKKITWTTEQIKELIKNKFGIEYSDWHICCLARKVGMNLRKPYQRDYRNPDNAKELLSIQLKLTFDLLKEKGIKNIALGMIDETAPQTTANTVRMWSFEKPVLKKNSSKIKSNTIGFYALKGESISMSMKNGKSEEICRFLEEIKTKNKDYDAIVIVLDNASVHKSEIVKAKAEELNIYFVYLPAYSPQLNPIEYIWKSIKRIISTTHIESYEHMSNLINNAFSQFSKSLSFASSWINYFLSCSQLLSV